MRASEWKVGVFFVGGINPSAPGGGGDPTGSETALTARQAATEKAIRALVPNSDQVLVPINTTSLQIRGCEQHTSTVLYLTCTVRANFTDFM